MTLSAKSSALHPGSQLLSTLISLLAPSTSTTTSLALHFSLHSPPFPLTSPLLLLLLLLGSPSEILEFSRLYFSPIGGCVIINFSFSLTHACACVTSKQHSCVQGPLRECRSIRSDASGLPYYCTPSVTVPDVLEVLTVWRLNKIKKCVVLARVCHACFPCILSKWVFYRGATCYWREY